MYETLRRPLLCHPATPCDALATIEVEVAREGARLSLRYVATGTIAALAIPAAAEPKRVDGLWEHTCFEAFAREADAPSYCEFNFSPSGEWAAYAFDGYRSGMRALEIASPEILVARGAAELVAKVTIGVTSTSATESVRARTHAVLGPNSRREAGSAGMTPLHLALSAVIEEANGRKSYWALAHPSGRPDFHHADCFALEIPAASES